MKSKKVKAPSKKKSPARKTAKKPAAKPKKKAAAAAPKPDAKHKQPINQMIERVLGEGPIKSDPKTDNRIKHPKKRAFLASYALSANVSMAAQAAGIHRETHYDWKKKDPVYVEAFEAAHEDAIDLLVHEARRRAYEGTHRPVFHQGMICGFVREYSDNLLMFLIKKNRPEYRERHELSTADGKPIVLLVRHVDETKKKQP